MFRSIVAGAALSLCLAGAAVADPFEDYLEFCIKRDGSAAAAAAGAEAAGWVKLPAEVFAEEDNPVRDLSVYMNAELDELAEKEPADLRMLMTGWGEGEEMYGLTDTRLDFCMIGVSNGDLEALRAQIAGYFEFPVTSVGDEEVWAYSRQGTRLQSEASVIKSEDPAAAARGRKIFLAGVIETDSGLVMLMLGALRPST